MTATRPILFVSAAVLSAVLWLSAQGPPPNPHPSPTFYLVVKAATCEPDAIDVYGASNLPPGAVIVLLVSDFDADAWRDYTDNIYVTLRDGGLFKQTMHPKQGLKFHRNLVVQSYFSPVYVPPQTRQPSSVLKIVGNKGENLGGLDNPQVGQLSGQNYYLTTIARVPNCGER